MKKNQKVSFTHFLEKFPLVDLPVILTEDVHLEFSRKNDPLPQLMIDQYLIRPEEKDSDEYDEYIPCFRIKGTEKFHAIVYWKAELMNYQYVLITYDLKGSVIDRSVIAGTKVQEDALIRSVATVDEDWIIYVVAGVAKANSDTFDPSSSKSFHLELLSTGKIISSD
ncbi:MAG: hypothetical protein AAF985_17555 [Bacteroidota bacterium]